MTAVRARSTWRAQDKTKIVCDGDDPYACRAGTQPMYGRYAVEARQTAREAGWLVGVPRARRGRRLDYCPACAERLGL